MLMCWGSGRGASHVQDWQELAYYDTKHGPEEHSNDDTGKKANSDRLKSPGRQAEQLDTK